MKAIRVTLESCSTTYMGMSASAAAERGMDYQAEYEGYRAIYYVKSIYIFHGFHEFR